MRSKTLSNDTIKNRKAMLDAARDAAIGGDPICGAMFALESLARGVHGGGFIATTAQDWRDEDDDDDIRPY